MFRHSDICFIFYICELHTIYNYYRPLISDKVGLSQCRHPKKKKKKKKRERERVSPFFASLISSLLLPSPPVCQCRFEYRRRRTKNRAVRLFFTFFGTVIGDDVSRPYQRSNFLGDGQRKGRRRSAKKRYGSHFLRSLTTP